MSLDQGSKLIKSDELNAKVKFAVSLMHLPTHEDITAELLTMGEKLNQIYLNHYSTMLETYGEISLGKLVASANKHFWLSCHEESIWIIAEDEEFHNIKETAQVLKNAQYYADHNGWAYTLYSYLSSLKNVDALKVDGFDGDDVLIFIGIYWLNVAEKLQDYSDKFDYVIEAMEAFGFVDYNQSHNFGRELATEESTRIRSKAAKKGLENNSVQIALRKIEDEYQSVKTQFKRYGYTAEFIRRMHALFPVIQSQKTIENLVTKLNRKNKDLPR